MNKRQCKYNKIFRGFTLVELLVVIAIMVILISVSLIGLSGSKESARDAQRKAALEVIRSGIELYKSDCNKYPIPSTAGDFYLRFGVSLTGDEGGCTPANSNVYIEENPEDPISSQYYYYSSDGNTYTICAGLEAVTTADAVCTSISANCGSSVTCSYHVNNP
jgi:prepilin-type N-terminal cleavage/methylation domain-containing protein